MAIHYNIEKMKEGAKKNNDDKSAKENLDTYLTA